MSCLIGSAPRPSRRARVVRQACGFFNYSQGINSEGEGGAECSKCMDLTIVFGMGAPGFSPANPHQCSITLSILSGLACVIFCPIICTPLGPGSQLPSAANLDTGAGAGAGGRGRAVTH